MLDTNTLIYLIKHRPASVAERVNRLAPGTPIGGNDLWIACHALALSCVLVTNNLREFQRIDALALENWADAG